jgi:hypothetical protein
MRTLLAFVATAAAVIGITTATIAPAQAAVSPSVLTVSNKNPLPAGGQNIIITGKNLDIVTAVLVDTVSAQIVSQSASTLVFITPAHVAARVGFSLVYGSKKLNYPDSLVYKLGPKRALVPLPYIPDTLKIGASFSMVPGNPAWVTTVKSLTPAVCSVDTALNVKALKRGSCLLQISIVLDTMDPAYRGRVALYDVTVG